MSKKMIAEFARIVDVYSSYSPKNVVYREYLGGSKSKALMKARRIMAYFEQDGDLELCKEIIYSLDNNSAITLTPEGRLTLMYIKPNMGGIVEREITKDSPEYPTLRAILKRIV